jgi:hypothetical protein
MEKIKFKKNILNTIIIPDDFTLKDHLIEAIYVQDNVANAPCFGSHSCNSARFNIFINGIMVLEDANLNNDVLDTIGGIQGTLPPLMTDGIGSNPLDRYSSAIISGQTSDLIRLIDKSSYLLEIRAHPSNPTPHENIVWIRIKDANGRITYSSCSSVGSTTDATEALIIYAATLGQLTSCSDNVLLEYRMSNLNLNDDYSVEYDILDIQYLNTIRQNEATYEFLSPCCSIPIFNEGSDGFNIKAKSLTVDCKTNLSLKCVQSALVQVKLLKNNIVISKDIAQVSCNYCNATETNNLFRVDFENLGMLGTVETLSFPNTVEQPIIIKNSSYVDAPIALLCSELNINRLYEYEFHFIPAIETLNIKPKSGRFFAGSAQQKVMSIFTITANQIIILYATLKDVETGLIKTTRPIYLYSSDNCNDMLKNFHYSEIEALQQPCNLEPCVFQQ